MPTKQKTKDFSRLYKILESISIKKNPKQWSWPYLNYHTKCNRLIFPRAKCWEIRSYKVERQNTAGRSLDTRKYAIVVILSNVRCSQRKGTTSQWDFMPNSQIVHLSTSHLLFQHYLRCTLAEDPETSIWIFQDCTHGLPNRIEGIDFVQGFFWYFISNILIIPL